MKEKYFLVFVIVIFFISCKKEKKATLLYVEEQPYQKERIVITKNPDTLENTTYSVYNEKDVLIRKVNYKGELKDGFYISFYDNGNIEKKIKFINDKKEGFYKEFYNNNSNTLKSKYFYKRDTMFGNQMEFHKNENISRYLSYDQMGENIFKALYDINGSITSFDGSFLTMSNLYLNKRKDSIVFRTWMSTPPKFELKYSYKINKVGEFKNEWTKVQIKNSQVTFKTELKDTLEYEIHEKLTINLNKNGLDSTFTKKELFKFKKPR